MSDQPIKITEYDHKRLIMLLLDAESTQYRGSQYLKRLRRELNRAKIVKPEEIPGDVITMNSTVRLQDQETMEEEVYTLVFPDNADVKNGKVSILAPIGTAMLGYRVGDIFEWEAPAGTRKLLVKGILFQPEASGNFEL